MGPAYLLRPIVLLALRRSFPPRYRTCDGPSSIIIVKARRLPLGRLPVSECSAGGGGTQAAFAEGGHRLVGRGGRRCCSSGPGRLG